MVPAFSHTRLGKTLPALQALYVCWCDDAWHWHYSSVIDHPVGFYWNWPLQNLQVILDDDDDDDKKEEEDDDNDIDDDYNSKKGKLHPCTGTEALYRLYGP